MTAYSRFEPSAVDGEDVAVGVLEPRDVHLTVLQDALGVGLELAVVVLELDTAGGELVDGRLDVADRESREGCLVGAGVLRRVEKQLRALAAGVEDRLARLAFRFQAELALVKRAGARHIGDRDRRTDSVATQIHCYLL